MYGRDSVFSYIYNMIAAFGEAYSDTVLLFFNSVFRRPLRFIYRKLKKTLRFILRGIVMFFAPSGVSSRRYADDVTRAGKKCFKILFTHPFSLPSVIFYYIKKALGRYEYSLKNIALWMLPLLLITGVFAGAEALSSKTLCLEISADGETLGFVADEKGFIDAKNSAREILMLSGEEASLPTVTYSLSIKDKNSLTGSDTLRDRLLERSTGEGVSACGVFVDGELLCAIKSESEGRLVLERLLSPYKNDSNYSVSFAEEIEFRQGLYGEGMILSAEELENELSSLTLREVKTEITAEETDFEVVELKTNALYSGTERVLLEGKKGYDQVTSLVTIEGGKKVSSREVSRLSVTKPVAQRVQVGTKPLDEAYSNSMGGIFLWPIIGAYGINSDYGYRWGKLHAGIDLGMGNSPGTSLGKSVIAVAQGTVIVAGVHSSYGYYVIIDHGGGLQTLYAHCLADSLMVVPGQVVAAGEPIARVGSTGYSTGPHLHFEVRVNGNRVNPRPYLGI